MGQHSPQQPTYVFKAVRASKHQNRARIHLTGPSKGGKTTTALRFAAELAGPHGRIVVLDTNHSQALLFAGDENPDGGVYEFDHLPIADDYAPERYMAAVAWAAAQGYDVLVVDGASQAWAGAGGVLERVDAKAARLAALAGAQPSRGGNPLQISPWADATPLQNRFVDALLRFPGHLIVTTQAKTEWIMEPGPDGKLKPKAVGLAPVQRDNFPYAFDLDITVDADHRACARARGDSGLDGASAEKPGAEFLRPFVSWLLRGEPAVVQQVAPVAAAAPPRVVAAPDPPQPAARATVPPPPPPAVESPAPVSLAEVRGRWEQFFTDATLDEFTEARKKELVASFGGLSNVPVDLQHQWFNAVALRLKEQLDAVTDGSQVAPIRLRMAAVWKKNPPPAWLVALFDEAQARKPAPDEDFAPPLDGDDEAGQGAEVFDREPPSLDGYISQIRTAPTEDDVKRITVEALAVLPVSEHGVVHAAARVRRENLVDEARHAAREAIAREHDPPPAPPRLGVVVPIHRGAAVPAAPLAAPPPPPRRGGKAS